MIFYNQELVDTLRKKCDQASKRIWISSPFIGKINSIKRIIGGNWMRSSVDFRILTDIQDGFIKVDTFNEFMHYGTSIRSLHSLHAKIYLIDDWCLITSANLTGTAFSRRYEIGTTIEDIESIEMLFMQWWKLAHPVSSIPKTINPIQSDYQDGDIFPKRCNLPPYSARQNVNDKYIAKCDLYRNFATYYESITGRNQDMVQDGYTLFQEIDYFFNYLYHEHPLKPSNKVTQKRVLTVVSKEGELKKYFKQLRAYYIKHKELWRLDRTHTIQNLLSPSNINRINWRDVKMVVDCLHCYTSYPLNRTRFLNKANNSIKTIIQQWDYLLHTGSITSTKIEKVTQSLRFFGDSAVQEVIGFYFPDKYPLMNSNSDCGMRFFGYNI